MKMISGLSLVAFVILAFSFSSGTAMAAYSGKITIDGSSTVFPVSEAVAEEAMKSKELRKVRVGVSFSGTGGGFKKFCNGEIEISGASRPIKAKELERCAQNGVSFIELPVAYDGIAVIVHPDNKCVSNMTTAELKRIWEPAAEGKITNWKQVRPSCPDLPLTLFGPGTDSGTFDYFTEEIIGESKIQRADYEAAEDDNVLVRGVVENKGALGYMGFAYYEQNQERLKLLGIDAGQGPVMASPKTIGSGSYKPLARPIFIYVSEAASKRPEVGAFVRFYLGQAAKLANEVGYASLGGSPAENTTVYEKLLKVFEGRKTGTAFSSSDSHKMTINQVIDSKL